MTKPQTTVSRLTTRRPVGTASSALSPPPQLRNSSPTATASNSKAANSAAANSTLKKAAGLTTVARSTAARRRQAQTAVTTVKARPAPAVPTTAVATSIIAPSIQTGRTGDHCDVQLLLLNAFHAPSRDEFHAWSEKPGYDPTQRLLIKQGSRLAAHLLQTNYGLRIGNEVVPARQIHWLATAPEFRRQGFATSLLAGAEQRLRADGIVLGMLRTTDPQFFAARGWAACEEITPRRYLARDVLIRLSHAQPEGPPLSVRYWRHVELPALMRMHDAATRHSYGTWERSEDDWRWLLSRKAFDHILVAIHGRDRFDLEDTRAPLVGYAIVRGTRVIELMTNPGYPNAVEQLLGRACGEVIENDRQEITLCAPPQSSVHRYLVDRLPHSNGEPREVQMFKLAMPERFLRGRHAFLLEQLQRAGLKPNVELGLIIDGVRYLLTVTRHTVKWQAGRAGRNYLTLRESDFTRLALGFGRLAEGLAAERITASNRAAIETAKLLFPNLPWWFPQWDELIQG